MLIGPPFPPDKPKKSRHVVSRMTPEEREERIARKNAQDAARASRKARVALDSRGPRLTPSGLSQSFALDDGEKSGLRILENCPAEIILVPLKRGSRWKVFLNGRNMWASQVGWLLTKYEYDRQ